jgi:pimeloyl-ACP methyl ester carboxylesterase
MRKGRRVGMLVVGVLAGGLAAAILPGVRREVGRLRALGDGRLATVTCLPFVERREVELESGGLRLRGDLYRAAGRVGGRADTPAPGIVLLHGSSVHGRRLPLYPALAHELTRSGYHVLAIDLRGFGESEDPPVLDDPAGWDFAADAIAAVDSLLRWAAVDSSRIHLVGHSFGAGPALEAAQRDPRIAKVVMIGPTRRYTERFLRPGAPDSAYYVERWQRDMRLPAQVPYETMVEVAQRQNVEHYADGRYPTRVPVLLTDGEREDPRDLASLRDVAMRMGPAATHWTTPGTDHYLHTSRLLREPYRWAPERLASTACYNDQVLGSFVEELDRWLAGSSSLPHIAEVGP